MKITNSSLLYRNFDKSGLTEVERSEVMGAMEASDRLAAVACWVFETLGKITSLLAPNRKLKHE